MKRRLKKKDTEIGNKETKREYYAGNTQTHRQLRPGPVSHFLILILIFFLTSCAPAPQQINNDGNRAFDKKDFAAAIQNYESAHQGLPQNAEPLYNRANAHYRQGDYSAAARSLGDSLPKADNGLSPRIYYNLGNTYMQSGQYDKAVEAYKETLRLTPGDLDAKHNLELALKRQEEQNQKEQQQDQQSGQADQPQQSTPTPEAGTQKSPTPPGQPQQNQQPATPSAQQPQPGELSQEQARLILDSAAQDTQSLEQYLQQAQGIPANTSQEDW